MTRRAWLGAGAGAAGLAGVGTALYRTAPNFWRQYVREINRPIEPPPHRPSIRQWPDRGLYAAWLGHSTLLLKVDGATILTDPVLFDRVGLSFGPLTLGLKRLVAPAVKIRSLPPIDLILLSHAHMDHFDVPSLRGLENKATAVVTARNTSDLLRPERYGGVRELGWGEHTRTGPFFIRAFEVNHWGARMRTDTYRGYNGYVIETGRYRVLFAGDTATTSFRPLRSSRPFDLAIMPIGAYNPWIRYHCTPEQAWEMGNQAGAERFIPVHHQTFQLSREPFLEPIERLQEAAGRSQDRIVIERIGQEFRA
ncbi:MAG: MBL fold metallo-hydrolase [Bryobacterales bacterium]|nr:MBL fold metallo-hydrolase [Bryobacterales bacterium]